MTSTVGLGANITLKYDGTDTSMCIPANNFTLFNEDANGNIIIKLGSTSGSVFEVQNSAGNPILTANSDGAVTIPDALTGDWIFTGPDAGITGYLNLIGLAAGAINLRGTVDIDELLTTTAGATFSGAPVTITTDSLKLSNNIPLYIGNTDDFSIVHNGINSVITSTAGNLLVNNTNATGYTVFKLGTATADTAFQVRDLADDLLFAVGGNGTITVTGDLNVQGTTTTIDSTTVSITDPFFKLAKDNLANLVDLGYYGKYVDGLTTKFAGVAWDSSEQKYRMFQGLQVEPTTTVNTGGVGYTVSTLIANLESPGNSSVAGTLSLGTSDELSIVHNGLDSVITSTTGNLRVNNTNATGATVFKLGTDTAATAFQITNNSGDNLFEVQGDGTVTIPDALTGDWIFTGPDAGITGNPTILTLATNLVTIAGNLDVTQGLDVIGAALTTAAGITNTAGEVLISDGNLQLNDTITLSLGTGDELSIVHDGTNSVVTSSAGNLLVNNTSTTGATTVQLGSDTSATKFDILNISDGTLLSVNGAGQVTSESEPIVKSSGSPIISTDIDVIYTTAQVLERLIIRDSLTAVRTDSLPTAANLVAAISGAVINHTFYLRVCNYSDFNLTVSGNTGVTLIAKSGTTLGSGTMALFHVRLTNVTTAAYTATVVQRSGI